MKRLILSIFTIAAFMSVSAQTVKCLDFENGNTDGWFIWKSMPNIKVIQGDTHKGEYALRVAGGADFDVKLEKGKYDVVAYAKLVTGESQNAKFILKARESSSSYKYVNVDFVEIAQGDKYRKVTIPLTVKQSGSFKITVQGAKGAAFMLDNVTIIKK